MVFHKTQNCYQTNPNLIKNCQNSIFRRIACLLIKPRTKPSLATQKQRMETQTSLFTILNSANQTETGSNFRSLWYEHVLKQITCTRVSSLNHSRVEIACTENHNFNIFISPETRNISIIPMFIILKTMELWCYKKVVDTSDLTHKTVTISNYEGRGNPALKKG
jgi:hypothetical protein